MAHSHTPCPCLSEKQYKHCCQPLHNNSLLASSAEQLMRSRYSAFYLNNIDYLLRTLHPRKRQTDDDKTLKQTIEQTPWLGLKIIRHRQIGNSATVEYIAFYQDNKIEQLHERSNFIKDNNKWFYLDGEFLDPIKLSRNEPCLCGSKNKFKKCHGKNI